MLPFACSDECAGGGVKIRQVVVTFPDWRCKFPAQAEIEGQFGTHPIIVLKVECVDVLAEFVTRLLPSWIVLGRPNMKSARS